MSSSFTSSPKHPPSPRPSPPGERENRRLPVHASKAHRLVAAREMVLPLPQGEGREGAADGILATAVEDSHNCRSMRILRQAGRFPRMTMKRRLHQMELTEPERYELQEGPFYHFEI